MIYEGKKYTHTDFNNEVSGVENKYQCWSIHREGLKRVSSCDNFILLKSFSSPIYNQTGIINFQRNYISISFYNKIEDAKTVSESRNYETLFIIPVEPESKLKIVADISKKHKL